MTDEEKAEEYYYKTYPTTLNIGKEERKKTVMDSFLAGLKVGREIENEYVKNNAFTSMKEQGLFPFGKWHRVADGDLPIDGRIVCDQEGNNVNYVKRLNKWFKSSKECSMINEEEFTKFDIEEKIKLFQNGIEILKQSIKTKKA